MKKFLVALFCMVAVFSGSAFAVESMGLYQVKAGDDHSTFFETVAYSYMARGHFTLQITFGERETQKIDKKSGLAPQFFFLLTRADYEKIFEGNQKVENFSLNDHMWARKISAETVNGKRTVRVEFENAIDDEITSVFKRGHLEIVLEKGKISLMRMMKEKKRMLGFGGYKTIFLGEARNMKRSAAGLSLRDEGEMGRLTTAAAIDLALVDKSAKSFQAALAAEKK